MPEEGPARGSRKGQKDQKEEPEGRKPVRYVSTRGEAPPLGFVEVLLAGLARDGGLYMPESWPALDGKTIAGFAGRPYAEVAVDLVRTFLGDAISEHGLARMGPEGHWSVCHP